MPANLPPQYFEAEKQYRLAKDIPEKIAALEKMLSIMPKHKGTDRLHGELRSKIAKLLAQSQRRPLSRRKESLSYIRKEGAGQMVLVGLPNVGKSQLVSAVTQASPDMADYPFTTKIPTSGMMRFENVQVQLVDVPPIVDPDAQSWLPSLVRNADALLLLVDLADNPVRQMETIIGELEKIRVRPRGKEGQGALDQSVIQKKALIAGNKNDLANSAWSYQGLALQYGNQFPLVSISAKEGAGLEELRQLVYQTLGVIRVYTKAPGGKPDLAEPIVLKRGSTVDDVATSVHKDLRARLKYAQVWGSGKYSGQRVKRDHVLEDGDIVELHI